ncbi:MAG: MerR family transcriptional regulator [Acidobacteriales bacterium]|nr:MerR family transcriptional regulator [Terriglobales bacterium]
MPAWYRIGEFAELAGVSAKTLRFYDEIGLLRPAGTDPRTRYRRYLPQQLQALASIVELKNLGVPLSEIRSFLHQPGANARHEALRDLKSFLERRIESATQSLAWINSALESAGGQHSPVVVVTKRRPAVPIASVRTRVSSYAEMVRFENELLASLPPHAIGKLRGVLWHHSADTGVLEGEAFVSLKERLLPRTYYDLKQLPAAVVASAYSQPDDESSERAYDGIRQWMQVREYRLAGPKRELELGALLEIQFPIE